LLLTSFVSILLQLTKGKSEEEAEMKRCLPSISKKPDPTVTKRTQPSDSKIVPVDVSDDCHKIGSVNVSIFLKFQFLHPVADVLHIQ
jgi:hypothetical protein